MRDYAREIKAKDARITHLGMIVATRTELRDVECHEVLRQDVVLLLRRDTGGLVSSRPATDEDRQVSILVPEGTTLLLVPDTKLG